MISPIGFDDEADSAWMWHLTMKNTMQKSDVNLYDQHTNSAKRQRCFNIVPGLLCALIYTLFQASVLASETIDEGQLAPNDARLQQLVSPCLDCHAIDNDSIGYVGPTLQGVVGRRIAGIKSYGYSAALYEKAAMGLSWDVSSLDRFLKAPQTMAPGIAMTYEGLADPEDRALLIAWLAGGPKPLAAQLPTANSLRYAPEVEAILQIVPDTDYGRYLSGNCLTCHFGAGASGSVPPIFGLPAEYFVNALLEYQQDKRSNRVMQTMSKPLGSEELAALSAFFSKPAP